MMWQTILLTAAVFAIAIAAMAVGVIFSNRRIRGSCGGLANLRDANGQTACQLCTKPSPDCDGNPPSDTEVPQQENDRQHETA